MSKREATYREPWSTRLPVYLFFGGGLVGGIGFFVESVWLSVIGAAGWGFFVAWGFLGRRSLVHALVFAVLTTLLIPHRLTWPISFLSLVGGVFLGCFLAAVPLPPWATDRLSR